MMSITDINQKPRDLLACLNCLNECVRYFSPDEIALRARIRSQVLQTSLKNGIELTDAVNRSTTQPKTGAIRLKKEYLVWGLGNGIPLLCFI